MTSLIQPNPHLTQTEVDLTKMLLAYGHTPDEILKPDPLAADSGRRGGTKEAASDRVRERILDAELQR